MDIWKTKVFFPHEFYIQYICIYVYYIAAGSWCGFMGLLYGGMDAWLTIVVRDVKGSFFYFKIYFFQCQKRINLFVVQTSFIVPVKHQTSCRQSFSLSNPEKQVGSVEGWHGQLHHWESKMSP